ASVLPHVDLPYGLLAGKEPRRPRDVRAIDCETPDALDSWRAELRPPARIGRVVRQVYLAHGLALTVDYLVGLPVDRAGFRSCRELVNDNLVMARRSGNAVGAGRGA